MAKETPISLPDDLVERLTKQAQAMGISLSAYVDFLEKNRAHPFDPRFVKALKSVFTRYPNTLRRLSQ